MARQTIEGPYRVKSLGPYWYPWEVVEIVDGQPIELRPRKRYKKRESAYAAVARMNRRWQRDCKPEESSHVSVRQNG